MRHLIVLLTVCAALIIGRGAQAEDRVIFVVDASGSMWGQVDGGAKITAARGVLNEVLPTLPDGQATGLVAYGHRREGDCGDIETMVAAAPDSGQAISEALDALTPVGKSPISAAVRHAADTLHGVEGDHLVVLISDGVETCAPDPCAAARSLAEHHATLTVNVVGFDVPEDEARAQLRCLAEETAGVFVSVSSEKELSEALPKALVVKEPSASPEPQAATPEREFQETPEPQLEEEIPKPQREEEIPEPQRGEELPKPEREEELREPEPAPQPEPRAAEQILPSPQARPDHPEPPPPRPDPAFHFIPILFTATDGAEGPKLTDQLFWQITNREGMIIDTQDAPEADMILEPGAYEVIVRRDEDGREAHHNFDVTGQTRPLSIIVALPGGAGAAE